MSGEKLFAEIEDAATREQVLARVFEFPPAPGRGSRGPGPTLVRDWRADAGCRDSDPDLFFPEFNDYRAARAICRRCPVADECLADAMADTYAGGHGMRGGLTPPERRARMSRADAWERAQNDPRTRGGRVCAGCGAEFEPGNWSVVQRYCTARCRESHRDRRYYAKRRERILEQKKAKGRARAAQNQT